jgi:hypothetical protein
MNRHERRAVEAQTRESFKNYDALYRRAFKRWTSATSEKAGCAEQPPTAAASVGNSHKHIHYEITDTGTAPDGRKMRKLPARADVGEFNRTIRHSTTGGHICVDTPLRHPPKYNRKKSR